MYVKLMIYKFGIMIYFIGGHMTLMGFLNSGVHSVMYTYYLLSAFGPALRPYLWWKKYLTTIQLAQFVAIFLHAAQLFVIDCPDVPIGLACWTCIYAVIFFSLFIDFYYRAYLYPTKYAFLYRFVNDSSFYAYISY
ncbi:Elongation of very long chain fatty acids protein [Armadillidium vulgare]|nr:Elongation of very long chain fatty acids protein [Armadillidium vulgare]